VNIVFFFYFAFIRNDQEHFQFELNCTCLHVFRHLLGKQTLLKLTSWIGFFLYCKGKMYYNAIMTR